MLPECDCDAIGAGGAGQLHDFTARTSPNFMSGAFMVANAIDDCVLLYRGSSCVNEQVMQTFRWHDLDHRLEANRREGRLFITQEPYTVCSMGAQDRLPGAALWSIEKRSPAVVLLSELCRYSMMGEPLTDYAVQLQKTTGLPCIAASSPYLDRDFTDALQSLLSGLARVVAERAAPMSAGRPEATAVIGYLPTRNEGDARGDIVELRRLLAGLGLEAVSIWLSGGNLESLRNAASAKTLICLPFGEEAGRILAARSDATTLTQDLPVSLADSVEWLTRLGEATGRSVAAREHADRELDRVVPLVDRYVTRYLRGKRVIIAATREWLRGISRCLTEDLGMEVVAAVLRQRRPGDASTSDPVTGLDRLVDPSIASIRHHVDRAMATGGLDLVVGSFWERSALIGSPHAAIPFLEFGFPQRRAHFLAPTPHLGFGGVVTWAQRVFDTLNPNVTAPYL